MGGKKTQTVKQESGPPEWLAPYYKDIANRAFGSIDKVYRGPYPNPLYAQPNATQEAVLQGLTGVANTASGTGIYEQLLQNAENVASGKYLDPNTNPALQNVISATINPIERSLFENLIPQLNDQTLGSGAFGGDRHGIAEGLLLENIGRTELDAIAPYIFGNYEKEREYQQGADKQFAGAISAGASPYQLLSAVGDTRQSYAQELLNEKNKLFELNQQQPFAGLAQVAALLNPGGFVSGTSTSTAGGKGGIGGALQGGIGGAQAGSKFGPFGAAAGGVLGGLFGGLG